MSCIVAMENLHLADWCMTGSFAFIGQFTLCCHKGSMPAAPAKAQVFTPAHIALYMSKLLFRLRHVPEDEAEEVRALLEQNSIEFFETFAGNWGISLPALCFFLFNSGSVTRFFSTIQSPKRMDT